MTTPAELPAERPASGIGWVALTASERGASHIAAQSPNEDAVATARAGERGVVAAVADGHGHWRHLRSERGSQIAVAVGCEVGLELAERLEKDNTLHSQRSDQPGPATTAGDARELVKDLVIPAVIERWRLAVLADIEANPFTDAEQDRRLPGDDPTVAYGSTLLLVVAAGSVLTVAQIGDGDVVCVRADGSAIMPVPPDPLLDGLVTTSLCGTDPASDFRVGAVDMAADPMLAVLLGTDGYGNAQLVQDWPDAFGRDMAGLLRIHDEHWLAGQLPGWTARCASADGSADDTTVALLISPAGLSARRAMPAGGLGGSGWTEADPGSDEITLPAVNRADILPPDTSAGTSPR